MSASPLHFDSLYSTHADPWRVTRRWYERRKLAMVLSMLPRQHYEHAFEPACGIGQITVELGRRCRRVLAADFSPAAVQATRTRVNRLHNTEVIPLALPAQWPVTQKFDLVVLSEWLYYLDDRDLESLCMAVNASVDASGDVLACHFRHDFDDRRQSAARMHARLTHHLGTPWACYDDGDVSIRVWSGMGSLARAGDSL